MLVLLQPHAWPVVSGGSPALLCSAWESCALQLLIDSCSETSVWQLTLHWVALNQNPQRRSGKMTWRAAGCLGHVSWAWLAALQPRDSLWQGGDLSPFGFASKTFPLPLGHSSCCLLCWHTCWWALKRSWVVVWIAGAVLWGWQSRWYREVNESTNVRVFCGFFLRDVTCTFSHFTSLKNRRF